ncbi:MAG: DUF3179 domain-containing protein [Caulobacterales bacterium]|nr:DUF3179 domain-containing protein [Caulobacterales bacterium]
MRRLAPTRRSTLALLGAGLAAPLGLPARAQGEGEGEIAEATRALIYLTGREQARALNTLRAYGAADIIPSLILAMRFGPRRSSAVSRLAADIAGEPGRAGWFEWMLWQQDHPEIVPHQSYAALKLELLHQIDPSFARFLNDETTRRDRMKIRLEEIVWGGVAVDGIPSLDDPTLITPAQASYLKDDDPVFGVAVNGDARAYPLRIMNWHEMFNDVIGGVPVALAYCTLCNAAILFETGAEGRDERFIFGSSGFLYRSNKLMFDRQTDSLWNQFTGEPVVGPLVDKGVSLAIRPVVITDWADWRAQHPDTQVLSLETGHRRDYGSGVAYRDYFASPDLMFPALADTLHLGVKDQVYGVRLPSGAKAWPIEAFRARPVINDEVGGAPVVLVGDAATRAVRAYARGGETFAAGDAPTRPVSADGATWTLSEDALRAPDGREAPRLPGHVSYWFAWNGYLGMESELYDGS